MNKRQTELVRIETFKQNWYALIVCICSEDKKTISQSLRAIGVSTKTEVAVKKNISGTLDKVEVEALYKELGCTRQVALKLKCNEMTLANFMRKNGIERTKVRNKISDKYDKKEIIRLRKQGKDSREIAKITGYDYKNLYNLVVRIEKEEVSC